MRRLLCCTVPRWGLTLAGLAAATVALAAWRLGLDNNPTMGPRRILLLFLGIGIVFLAHRSRVADLLRRGGPRPDHPPHTGHLPPDRVLTESQGADLPYASRFPWAILLLILPAILTLYVWLFTAGKWTNPPGPTTYYYDLLAEAFAAGQTSLIQAPDPRLAQLANPYDPAQRAGIPRCRRGTLGSDCFVLDASYLNGRYYLYWGPAPAALLALLKVSGLGRVGDNAFALFGTVALFVFLVLGLLDLWRRYFSRLPRWLLAPPLLLAGLAYPLPWVLDTPLIYEAAILQGAAFLVAGLTFAIPVLTTGDHKPWRLALVGVLWSLSFGTRIVLALPIAVLGGAMAWSLWRARSADPRPRSRWKPFAALSLPVLTSAALIGMYNFARFSDPLESGWRYALGGGGAQFAGLQAVFKWGNIPTNAYNYILGPASISGEFPFVRPLLASRALGPIQIPHPGLFLPEYVTGLLVSTPFVVFALYLIWSLTCGPVGCADSHRARPSFAAFDQPGFRGLVWVVCLASVTAFLPILTLYAVTGRYLLDVAPLLMILATLGAWTAYAAHARTPLKRLQIGSAILAAAGVSGVVSVLLALNNLSR